ncbi:MAG: ABC transporter ATP-binding protein [Anaerolineales bacterium]|nr:ABC transporter ATP-binding protein [Anaerolineales bacterium]
MKPIAVELQNVIKEFSSGRSDQARAVDDVSLQIYDGEFFALLGPSGCGKTTTLRMIAGFEEATSGDIRINGKSVRYIPPFHRPVNTVFQDYALFPHMTVLQNVMFGLQMENVSKATARERAMEALELVQLPQAAFRKPRQLSGGMQQRVALARALVKKPSVLLLDEPLGALDLKLRKAMQFELKAMQQQLGITFVYVTHDQEEAMTMADRIAVMNKGELLQVGSPETIYEKPTTRFVADFIGETNFVEGSLHSLGTPYGRVLVEGATLDAVLGEVTAEIGDTVTVAIRPEKIGVFGATGAVRLSEGFSLSADEFKANLRKEPNMTLLDGVVNQVFYIGTDTRYQIALGENVEVVARVQNFGQRHDTIYKAGDPICVYWENENARILAH